MLHHAGSFAALEAALWREVRTVREGEALAPIVVLVPTTLLRRHLLTEGARQGGILNVHIVTLHALAAALGGPALAQAGRALLSRAGRELVARAVCRSTPAGYYAALSDRPGFHRALLATLDDLKESAVSPADLDGAAGRLEPADASLARRLRDLARLWGACEERMAAKGLHDDADLLAAAAEAAASAPWLARAARFIVYGFYDLNPLQRRLVAACAACCPSCVLFPADPDAAAFTYARPTFDWFVSQGFEPRGESEDLGALPTGLRALRSALFAQPGDAAGAEGVRIVSAPDEAREVRAVMGAALTEARAGTPLPRVGVLLRHASSYAERFVDECESGGLVAYHHDPPPLSTTQAGKSLLLLLHLVDGDLARADVMEFITSADIPFERLVGADVSPADWDLLSIEAGVVKGREDWADRLDAHCRLLEARLRRGAAVQDKLEALERLATFMERWLTALEAVPASGTWADVVDGAVDLFEEFVSASDDRNAVAAAVRELRALDVTGEQADLPSLRRLARETLDQRRPQTRGFGSQGPVIVNLLEGRGLPFDVVCVPGMVEKQFPAPPAQDPLLPDRARHALARAGLPVGPKGGRAAEERLLFRLAIGAATRAVVLSCPRLGGGSGRDQVPSHFLLRASEAVTGQRQGYAGLAALPFHDQIAGTAFAPAEPADSWRAAEYDLAAAQVAVQAGRAEALAWLRTVSRTVGAALRAEHCRWAERRFTEYDGALQSPAALDAVAALLGDRQRDVAPTTLEQYASCPFQFFLRRVLRIEPVEEPETGHRLTPLDRGSLLHEILYRAVSQACEEGRLPLDEGAALAVAESCLAAFEREAPPAAPELWALEREGLLLDVRRFVRAEAADDSGFVPARLELCFGQRAVHGEGELGCADSIPLNLGDAGQIALHGRIDRVDSHHDEPLARVLDYKTGSARGSSDSFAGGSMLQLPIYLHAAQSLLGDDLRVVSAAYRYICSGRDVGFSAETLEERRDEFQTVLATIVRGVSAGQFFAGLDTGGCRYCDYAAVCGTAASHAAQRKCGDPAAAPYLAMREIP